MKRRIRLTESDLHRIVKESVDRVLKEGNKTPNQDHLNERIIKALHKSGHISGELMKLMIDQLCGYPEDYMTPSVFLGRAANLCKDVDIYPESTYFRQPDGSLKDGNGKPITRDGYYDDSYVRSQEMRDPWGGY